MTLAIALAVLVLAGAFLRLADTRDGADGETVLGRRHHGGTWW